MKSLFICVFIVLIFGGCSTSSNLSGESKARLQSHKTIAILPFEVRFDLRNNNRKQFTEKELAEVRHFMATGLQEHLYHWLISYSKKKPFTIEIQHIDITDSILSERKIRFIDLYSMSRAELAKMLHVDAIITANVIFAQPNSEAAAVALEAIPGQNLFVKQLVTQEMKMQIFLNDTLAQNTLWQYETKTQNSNYTKQTKDRKKENILYPLFENIDKTLVKVIKQFPYHK